MCCARDLPGRTSSAGVQARGSLALRAVALICAVLTSAGCYPWAMMGVERTIGSAGPAGLADLVGYTGPRLAGTFERGGDRRTPVVGDLALFFEGGERLTFLQVGTMFPTGGSTLGVRPMVGWWSWTAAPDDEGGLAGSLALSWMPGATDVDLGAITALGCFVQVVGTWMNDVAGESDAWVCSLELGCALAF